MSNATHDTVGRAFKAHGGIWRCTRYDHRAGFWMRLEQPAADPWPYKAAGDETCVSERAIGATFHRDWRDASHAPHEHPCDCSMCRGGGS